VLVKNDDYYDGSPKGKPSIGNIVVRTIPELNTQIAETMAGQLDWIWKVPADQAERLDQMGRFTVKNSQTMRIGYLAMDAAGRSGENPFQNEKVRQAVSYAIDRQGSVDALVKGESQVVHSACFPSQFGCSEAVMKYEYDPAKAKRLMAEAGYPEGFETPFYAYRERDYAEAMISNLNDIGIKTQFQFLKYAALRDKVQAGEIPFTFMTWGSYSINDASAITSQFFKFGADDMAHDEQVKQWLETADTSTDSAVRAENYAKALQRIAEQAYWLPLWSYNTNYVYTQDLEFEPTPDEIPRFFTMSWK
jgi:peptide/nickel transport system substrate-binding protein